MTATLTPAPPRSEQAGALLREALAEAHLPPWLPGEPNGLAASVAANVFAPRFLAELARLYDVDAWTPESFSLAFGDALRAWHGDAMVTRTSDALRVVSGACPMLRGAARDPRLCQFCQDFQQEAARQALHERVASVRFTDRLTKGDEACATEIRFRTSAGKATS